MYLFMDVPIVKFSAEKYSALIPSAGELVHRSEWRGEVDPTDPRVSSFDFRRLRKEVGRHRRKGGGISVVTDSATDCVWVGALSAMIET